MSVFDSEGNHLHNSDLYRWFECDVEKLDTFIPEGVLNSTKIDGEGNEVQRTLREFSVKVDISNDGKKALVLAKANVAPNYRVRLSTEQDLEDWLNYGKAMGIFDKFILGQEYEALMQTDEWRKEDEM